MIWNFKDVGEKSQIREYLDKLIQEFNEEFRGRIEIYENSTGDSRCIISEFYIRVPRLKYTIEIFKITQDIISEYPIKIYSLIKFSPLGEICIQKIVCNNFEEFKQSIEEITQSEEMNSILRRLNSMI